MVQFDYDAFMVMYMHYITLIRYKANIIACRILYFGINTLLCC